MNPSICIIYSSIVEMTQKNSLQAYSDRTLLADEYNNINQSCSCGCLLYDFVGIYFSPSKRFHIVSLRCFVFQYSAWISNEERRKG